MRLEQWRRLKRTAKGHQADDVPLAMIVDSPWIPSYLGIHHLDYFLDPDLWFESNLQVMEQFPAVVFVPSWWVEYGMAIEPSAYGGKVCFWPNRPPDVVPCFKKLSDAAALTPANPECDGLMPLALRLYRTQKQRVFDAGYTIPIVTARGPLCLASFLRGITDLLLDLCDEPKAAHRMLDTLTQTVIRWLQAQCEAIGDSVEGVFVLDDVPGMLSREMYLEFAHPYLQQVFDAFPKDWVKIYHNDANVRPFAGDLADLGIDVLNWSHKLPVEQLLRATGGRICPMGNVAPLDLGVNGTPEQVRYAALEVLAKADGNPFILSLGGGTSPGMPRANIEAMIEASAEWRKERQAVTGAGARIRG